MRRFVLVYYLLLAVVLLALIPPYISVNRFQHRIATSISQSLGRPVHLDRVTLHLLPLPGFTLQNLVVDEDPAFGSEPVIRANSVEATLRVSSLWRRRVEFSSISFTEPSVNLVHLPNGTWNLESILLQAAHIDAAPTAQKNAGAAPRFPYIEATGARVNLKLNSEKIPLALTDSAFALWLPNPQEWHVRVEAHPVRTDTSVSDTGIVRLEGTLGRASSLNEVPVNLEGDWSNAPLGEASRVLLGRDAGVRGEMTLSAKVHGTVGNSSLQARLQLSAVRRADFIPEHPLAIDVECLAMATTAFHTFSGIQCSWPPAADSSQPTLLLTGLVPDVRRPETAAVKIVTQGIQAGTVLDWLHVASVRVPADVSADGLLAGLISYTPELAPAEQWDGQVGVTGVSLKSVQAGLATLKVGDLLVRSAGEANPVPARGHRSAIPTRSAPVFELAPATLALGGKDPAILDGQFDSGGYTLHLTGMVVLSRLMALGTAIPQLGDGLREVLPSNRAAGPVRVDLTATRAWGGSQVWQDGLSRPVPGRSRRSNR